jgi:type I restriction enzyme M protein
MLDTETKRRIDNARDILVGKIPDPKSQVEQITIALIYKFMDDMDADSVEMGGKPTFFVGDYEKYAWRKIFDPRLGGFDMLALYSDAIVQLNQNPHLPQLFRDIFKNAYLPYRDPETLKLFLKTIDEFHYDHSERLGDAFEYLLSVLGSQGDAGQFRTPRHIIDFIVQVVNPQKNDRILDPACGTAGFLISAFKHILKNNHDMTPSERAKLMTNIVGYDISPDMVRLALVNMYLHGFKTPEIHEYDTLTSEDRWNDYFDVILANPPFMSPKGGIKPHKKFSIDAKRSEVLFVDYIAEHINPKTGRAGIIVPEGIIFQSQTAYKALRKMLVEHYLVAVVSLPAGVFNPYSGVKTSILILDKSLAKESDTVGFFKVENDGFGLGAQRRPIEGEQLTQTRADVNAYLRRLRAKESLAAENFMPTRGLIVPKEKLAANGDYNLSGERYAADKRIDTQWPIVAVGEITVRTSGGTPSKEREDFWRGTIPWVSPKDMKVPRIWDTEDHISQSAVDERNLPIVPAETLLCVVRSGILKHTLPLALTAREMSFNQDIIALEAKADRLLPAFLYWTLKSKEQEILVDGIKPGVTVQSFHNGFFSTFEIPLPPLDVQNEIVVEIDGYQKVIDGARAVLDHYRPRIPISPEWPMVELGEICDPEYGFTASAGHAGPARFIRITDISPEGTLRENDAKFVELTDRAKESLVSRGDLLVARTGATFGKTMIFEEDYPAVFASFLIRLRFPAKKVVPRYYWAFAQSDAYWSQANALVTGGGQPQFNGNAIRRLRFPLPPLSQQEKIVAEIDAEQRLVKANRQLIERMEQKIAAVLARIWGESEGVDNSQTENEG